MLTAILKEAWISIASYKLRTFLTMLGIMIGVAAVVMMCPPGRPFKTASPKLLHLWAAT